MRTEREQIEGFLQRCDELMRAEFIIADTKIGDLLKSIVSSDLLYGFFREITRGFDYPAALARATGYAPYGDARKKLMLPSDPAEELAFLFCLLADIDSGAIDLSGFLNEFFYAEGGLAESFHAFCGAVVMPLRDGVRGIFSEDRPRAKGELPLEAERRLIYASSLPDGQKVDALLLLNGLLSDKAKEDRQLFAALLSGYACFTRAFGWESENVPALLEALRELKEEL